jgi:hypothetical protein
MMTLESVDCSCNCVGILRYLAMLDTSFILELPYVWLPLHVYEYSYILNHSLCFLVSNALQTL